MTQLKYLVAVDISEEADEVLAAGRKAANEAGADLACVTVVRPLAGVYGGMVIGSDAQANVTFEEEALTRARDQLLALAAEYGIAEDSVHVCLGTPAAEIRSLAEQQKSDTIVIGTHGRQGLGLLLGSTASAVLHGIPCDALVVKIHPSAD